MVMILVFGVGFLELEGGGVVLDFVGVGFGGVIVVVVVEIVVGGSVGWGGGC